MNRFLVNGIEIASPVAPEATLHDLIQFVRMNFSSEKASISSVRVDGSEILTNKDNNKMAYPLSQIGSVEVYTAHPREVAQETLQNLIEYLPTLESFCRRASQTVYEKEFAMDSLSKVIEGITILTDAVLNVKQVFRIGIISPLDVLEADLLSIMKDILSAQQRDQKEYMEELLGHHLPKNLEQWRTQGLPALIRARDS
jgi:phosphoenolpyruvate carboxylase